MKQPLIMTIAQAWESHRRSIPEGIHIVDQSPVSRALEEEARKLEEILAGRIKTHLDDYNEGLISAAELIGKLSSEGLQEYES